LSWSFAYLALRCLLQLVLLRPRSETFKELEIVVLRHELSLLRRQVARPQLEPSDRVLLAAASRLLPRSRWSSFLVSPACGCRKLGLMVGNALIYRAEREFLERPPAHLRKLDTYIRTGRPIDNHARDSPRRGRNAVESCGGTGFLHAMRSAYALARPSLRSIRQ
jgi:putative transposase